MSHQTFGHRADNAPLDISQRIAGKGEGMRWKPVTRVAFRFAFSYVALYCLYLINELQGLLYYFVVNRAASLSGFTDPLWHNVVPWIGKHILHLGTPMTVFSNGSGDTTYDWVLVLTELVLTGIATLVWSLLDKRRPNYRRLHEWLRLVVRVVLGAEMLVYGADKVIPLQFGSLGLSTLVRPFGTLSPISLLWSFMAASKAYTIFSGAAELLGGLLLFIPRLTTLGALISFADMANVFMLNLSYDVPVKLVSFHLLLLSVFLLVPDASRLANLFVLNRPALPIKATPLSDRRWVNQSASVIPAIIGVALLCVLLNGAWRLYSERQAALAHKPALYGIWTVDEFTVTGDGSKPLLPKKLYAEIGLTPEEDRWQRLVIESPKILAIQMRSGLFEYANMKLDPKTQTATLSESANASWKCEFTFRRPRPESLDVEGVVNGRPFRAGLHRMDESKFLLTSRGFHWISEHPFFR